MRTTRIQIGRARFRVLVVLILMLLLVPVAAIAAGGSFTDDDASVFEADIEWLAAHGITFGCNPPANDNFCPNADVTRGQMAAFMHRLADDQANVAYSIGLDTSTEIKGQDFYETVLELTGLPAGSYHVIAKAQFQSSELMTRAGPTCKLMAGHEFDTVLATVEPAHVVPFTLTAVTYLAEDNSAIHLDCRDYGEMVTLRNIRITAVGVNEIVINPVLVP